MASMEISHITEQHCVLLPAVRLCDMATQCSAIFILCLLTENVETIYLFRMTIFEISGAILMQKKKTVLLDFDLMRKLTSAYLLFTGSWSS